MPALLASPWLLAGVLAIVCAAAIIQAGLGMGFGLMAAPLLALLDPELVPAPTLMLGMAAATWGGWSERRRIAWNEVSVGVIGRVAGVAAGALLLAGLAGTKSFLLVFGCMTMLAVVLTASGWKMPFNRPNLIAMTALSGLMGTITSVGAPPLAIIYRGRAPGEARPTLAAFFALGCVISLTGLWLAGVAGVSDVANAALLAPGMVAGTLLSRRLRTHFDLRYRGALLAVAGLAAVLLIVRGLS